MEALGWIGWGLLKLLGLVWTIVWFLLSGWVATLLQLVVIVGAIFAMKYGWRRAPAEMWRRASTFGRFVWAWARARELSSAPAQAAGPAKVREVTRVVHRRQPGDVSLSTLLSVLMLAGLLVAGAL